MSCVGRGRGGVVVIVIVVGGWRSEVDGCRLAQLAGDDPHVSYLNLLHLITVRISQQLLRRRARRLSGFRKKDLMYM